MREPTKRDVDQLLGAATPHFAYQIRQRLERLVSDLPRDHPVRSYAENRMVLLEGLGHTTSKGDYGDPSAPQ